jgi:hypothetical protein
MKNFNYKEFLTTAGAVILGLAIYDFGKNQMNKMKTTPPAATATVEE